MHDAGQSALSGNQWMIIGGVILFVIFLNWNASQRARKRSRVFIRPGTLKKEARSVGEEKMSQVKGSAKSTPAPEPQKKTATVESGSEEDVPSEPVKAGRSEDVKPLDLCLTYTR